MSTENFAYWLQGFSEICGESPTPQQWKIIQDHLALVFKKETPVYPDYAQFHEYETTPIFPEWTSFGTGPGSNPYFDGDSPRITC